MLRPATAGGCWWVTNCCWQPGPSVAPAPGVGLLDFKVNILRLAGCGATLVTESRGFVRIWGAQIISIACIIAIVSTYGIFKGMTNLSTDFSQSKVREIEGHPMMESEALLSYQYLVLYSWYNNDRSEIKSENDPFLLLLAILAVLQGLSNLATLANPY